MATVSDIVTRVQRRVIDLPANVQAEVQQLVEDAHREIQERHNFKAMEALGALTTTVGSQVLASDLGLVRFKEYKDDPFWTDDFGHTYFLKVMHDEGEVKRAFNSDVDLGRGRPRVLLHRRPVDGEAIELHEIWVFPVPDGLAQTSTGEYTIRIPYWQYLAFPASSDWFTINASQWLIDRATAEAFALDWDLEKHQLWLAKAEGHLQRTINVDKQFYVSGIETMVPYAGPNAPKVRL